MDGVDVWPTLTKGQSLPSRTILLNTAPNSGAIRAGDWKLVVHRGTDNPDGGPARPARKESVELFNLKADPSEKTNVADREPAGVKELRAALDRFAAQAVPPKNRPKPKDFAAPRVWGEPE